MEAGAQEVAHLVQEVLGAHLGVAVDLQQIQGVLGEATVDLQRTLDGTLIPNHQLPFQIMDGQIPNLQLLQRATLDGIFPLQILHQSPLGQISELQTQHKGQLAGM